MSDCKCGHFVTAHMHNFTGEMFGSTIAHCVFCPCQNYEPCAGAPYDGTAAADPRGAQPSSLPSQSPEEQ